MSLEAALNRTSDLLERLIAVLQSQQITPAADTPSTPVKATRPRKGTAANPLTDADAAADLAGTPRPDTSATVNDGTKSSEALLPGDAAGTRYFHIAKHNTVAKVAPGEVIPSIEGTEEVSGSQYENWRMHYATKLVPTEGNVAAGTPTPATPATSAAPTASAAVQQPSPATSTTGDSGVLVMEKAKALHARDGNDGLAKFLKEQGVGRVGELVAATAKHADALKALEALLNPTAPAAGPDLF